jgi:putative hydrolase of the HAD superfamily
LGILDEFDSVINSAEVGAAKPDRAIFLAALRALGVEAASAIFVDDQQRNVEGAVAMGMLGHTFSTAEALERSLKAHWGTRAA